MASFELHADLEWKNVFDSTQQNNAKRTLPPFIFTAQSARRPEFQKSASPLHRQLRNVFKCSLRKARTASSKFAQSGFVMCDWLSFCVPQSSKGDGLNESVPRAYQPRTEPPSYEKPAPIQTPMAGIGAAFESVDGGGLFVHSFAAGGPAQACGLIQRGDQLISVDGIDVRGMSAKELAQVLIGPVGSKVLVGFSRKIENSSQTTQIQVELVRQQSSSSRHGTPRADSKPSSEK